MFLFNNDCNLWISFVKLPVLISLTFTYFMSLGYNSWVALTGVPHSGALLGWQNWLEPCNLNPSEQELGIFNMGPMTFCNYGDLFFILFDTFCISRQSSLEDLRFLQICSWASLASPERKSAKSAATSTPVGPPPITLRQRVHGTAVMWVKQ